MRGQGEKAESPSYWGPAIPAHSSIASNPSIIEMLLTARLIHAAERYEDLFTCGPERRKAFVNNEFNQYAWADLRVAANLRSARLIEPQKTLFRPYSHLAPQTYVRSRSTVAINRSIANGLRI